MAKKKTAIKKKAPGKKKVAKKAPEKKVEERSVVARGSLRLGRSQVRWEWDGKWMEIGVVERLATLPLYLYIENAEALVIDHPAREYKALPESPGLFYAKLPGLIPGQKVRIRPLGEDLGLPEFK